MKACRNCPALVDGKKKEEEYEDEELWTPDVDFCMRAVGRGDFKDHCRFL